MVSVVWTLWCFLAAGKSELTVLAERFRRDFCTDHAIGRDVNLNDVANALGVQRRRLYDIVNVLEALQVGGHLKRPDCRVSCCHQCPVPACPAADE